MFRRMRIKQANDDGHFTAPGLESRVGDEVNTILQDRLVSLIDTALTLKHIHWNVVGPNFIGVHKMLDPQVEGVQGMVDEVAERIATLGGSPIGLPGYLVNRRHWDDYEIGRANVQSHLGALDVVYTGVISSHRDALERLGALDLVTQELIIEQTRKLELFQWFVRAHLEDSSGVLSTEDIASQTEAAEVALRAS
jgi:starvation-inducible DNA-binding protein